MSTTDEAVLLGRHRVGAQQGPARTIELYPKSPQEEVPVLCNGTPSAPHCLSHSGNTHPPFSDVTNKSLGDQQRRSVSASSPSGEQQCPAVECMATPSAAHRGGPREEALLPTPTWEGRPTDYISTTPRSKEERPLSGDQTGALFASFSLPVSNFHALPHMIPIPFQGVPIPFTWDSQTRPALQEPLTSRSSMENLIPSC